MSIMLTKDDWVEVTLILLLLSACASQDHQPSQGEEGHGEGVGRRRHHDSNAKKIAAQNLTLNSFFLILFLTVVTALTDQRQKMYLRKEKKTVLRVISIAKKKTFCKVQIDMNN